MFVTHFVKKPPVWAALLLDIQIGGVKAGVVKKGGE